MKISNKVITHVARCGGGKISGRVCVFILENQSAVQFFKVADSSLRIIYEKDIIVEHRPFVYFKGFVFVDVVFPPTPLMYSRFYPICPAGKLSKFVYNSIS